MKSTQYFKHTRERADRKAIKDEWIIKTINNPDHTELQKDGRIRKWKYIESENKYLRIITLEDNETIHNAFFDRRFKGTVQ
ncbi:MAG: hypothetical protein ACRBCT_01465 [Alphaproteobacteria bacterium]